MGPCAMADSPAGVFRQADACESDALLATKLYLPRLRPGNVSRPRLLEQLDDGLLRGLILVCASAGFGKTALLSDWARRGDRRVAWLSLDAGDNDPARFWRHAAAALDRVRPGAAERVVALLGPPPPRNFEGIVTALINDVAAQSGDGDVVLVLDDYHVIESHRVHDALTFLLEHRPAQLHVVLSTRADPPLPLARLRARGQLVEVRDADLRLTAAEAAAVLREALGPDLPLADVTVAALADRTEGWAAGLQLAALSLRGQSDVAEFVATFSGSHRFVLDYLTEEVLERQTAPVREFLLHTSVLERLSGQLCDAVTGRSGGQAMLEAVERANLFLVPLDEVRGWWRYHHLFADLLRARLEQQHPDLVAALHRKAAAWYERHEIVDDAVRHALAAGDADWAGRLIEQYVDERLLRSERVTLERWLGALPDEVIESRPRLLLVSSLLAIISARVEAVPARLDAAERAVAASGGSDEPYEPSVGRSASLVANVPAAIAFQRAFLAELRGDVEAIVTFGARALAELGEDQSTLASITRGHLGVADWLQGRIPEAERALASSIAALRAAGQRFLAVRMCESLGQVHRGAGDLEAARATYQLALEIATSRSKAAPTAQAPAASGIADVGLAEVAYQQGDLVAARRHVAQGIASCRQLAYTQPLAVGLATLAWIRQAEGDHGGAAEAMDEAMRVVPGPGVASLLNPVPAQRARLLLAQGEIAAAANWVKARGGHPGDEPTYPREPEYLVLARVLLAQNRPGPALGLLERLEAMAGADGRTGSLVELRAVRALALASAGDPAALDVLADALALAGPRGYVRVFADEGAAMRALIGRLVAAGRTGNIGPPGYLSRLMRAFEPSGDPDADHRGPAGVPGLIDPLSSREIEVLRLLASGRQNREIAEQLVVALSTVKKHVTHILDKLGAQNRTEATARAREFGLIP